MDISFVHKLFQITLIFDSNGEQVEGHFHILKVLKICHQVEILDVEAQIFGPFCANHAIPMDFGSIKVCNAD
jgi:hypothetical protein